MLFLHFFHGGSTLYKAYNKAHRWLLATKWPIWNVILNRAWAYIGPTIPDIVRIEPSKADSVTEMESSLSKKQI